MNVGGNLPNRLRNWFGMLAFLSLLIAGLAFGATRVLATGLERDAVADAGSAASSVIRPALEPRDVATPMSGERYASLRDTVRRRVMTGDVTSVEIWNDDGTIVFADNRDRLGQEVPAMRALVHDAHVEGSRTIVEGDTFRALVSIGVGDVAAVVEIDRPHDDIVARAERWLPWTRRGISAAVVFLGLYVAAVAASLIGRRRRAAAANTLPTRVPSGNAAPIEEAHVNVRRRKSDHPDRPRTDGPAYTQPGFREQVEARLSAESELASAREALAAAEVERQRLQQRLDQAESELEDARRRLAELGATAGR